MALLGGAGCETDQWDRPSGGRPARPDVYVSDVKPITQQPPPCVSCRTGLVETCCSSSAGEGARRQTPGASFLQLLERAVAPPSCYCCSQGLIRQDDAISIDLSSSPFVVLIKQTPALPPLGATAAQHAPAHCLARLIFMHRRLKTAEAGNNNDKRARCRPLRKLLL